MNLYAFILGVGSALGLLWTGHRAPVHQAAAWVTAGLWILLGALVGGRAVFVAAHWAYFWVHWSEAPQVWLGGLLWPGALAGALLVQVLLRLIRQVPVSFWWAGFLPLALPVIVAGWLGCWQAGCAYGPASSAWWALPAPDELGAWARRLPLQPAGAALTLGWFALVEWAFTRLRRPGLSAGFSLLGLGLILLGLSIFRADPLPLVGRWRLDAWAALGTLGLSALGIAAAFIPFFAIHPSLDLKKQ